MKVLHVIPSLSPKDGGPSFALPLIAKGLAHAGVQVDVAATVGKGEIPGVTSRLNDGECAAQVMRDGVNYFYFRRQTEFYKVSFPLARWLSARILDYDLVHIHALFSYSSYCAATIATKAGVPYVIRPLGVLNRWGMQNRRRLLKRASFRLIEKRILRNAATIHFTSKQEKLEAEETGTIFRSEVIPLGIDTAPFVTLPDPEKFYERFPHTRGRDIILFLSRVDQKKGLDLLLRAFAEIVAQGRPNRDDARQPLLVIAGDGDKDFVAKLQRLERDLNINDHVLWAGFLDGAVKLSALAAASIFVLPSYSENFGIALVEAMAAGLPSVSSDSVAIAEDANECEAGLVVPCEVQPLSSAIRRLLDEPELRCRLGSKARRLVEDRFSLDSMTSSIVELYGRILSHRSPAPSAFKVAAHASPERFNESVRH